MQSDGFAAQSGRITQLRLLRRHRASSWLLVFVVIVIEAQGCNVCSGTGYRGRLALTEVMKVDESLDSLIISGATSLELRREAERTAGMKSLLQDGHVKIKHGLTTLEELIRVT